MTTRFSSEEIEWLDREILQAHSTGRPALDLARLYHRGTRLLFDAGDEDAALFCCSTAYVYALEAGEDGLAKSLRALLYEHGREHRS